MSVTVYSTPNCMQCKMTYREFDKRGIPYSVVDLSEDAEAMERMRSLGHRHAPIVEVGEDVWTGFRPDLIGQIAQSESPDGSAFKAG